MSVQTYATLSIGACLAAVLVFPGPADAKRKKQDSGATGSSPYSTEQVGGYTMVSLDINDDGSADIWNYYQVGDTGGDPIRREIDLNRDGRPDVVTHFSGAEMVREEIDADFDGAMDWVDFYEAGLRVRSEWDTDFDGRPDLFKYYSKGKVERIEQDARLPRDGRVDYWEYYENGVMQRAGRDIDGDGNIDEWGE
jgi:hypothetical protein